MIIKSLLDTDVYKFYMQQAAYHQYPNTQVVYKFVCRNKDVDLSPYVDEVLTEIKLVDKLRISAEEIEFLSKLKKNNYIFKKDFLNFLRSFKMNSNDVQVFVENNQLAIEVRGNWVQTIHWEIYCLSIVNEVYFRNTQPNLSKDEGRERTSNKINMIQKANEKDVQLLFSEFGTRRRFSAKWQEEVCLELKDKLSNKGFTGSSNIYLSMKMGMDPVGTCAHEFLQAHQILGAKKNEDSYLTSQENALKSWIKEYDKDLLIALSDIYGTDAFLSVFDKELSEKFTGLRQDSGDPFEWVDKVISHYEKMGIDPKTKTVVFSDSLDIPKALSILEYCNNRIKVLFGIGTHLSNDLGVKALNIVMKMIECEGKPVVKISDEPAKGIGDKSTRDRIEQYFKLKQQNVSRKDILAKAQQILGSDLMVKKWLSSKVPALSNQRPEDVLKKDPALVMQILLQIEHGVYS